MANRNEQKNLKQTPILLVDVGNTYIHFAVFVRGDVVARFGVESVLRGKALANKIQRVLKELPERKLFAQAVICSVVPSVTSILEKKILLLLGLKAQVVGRDLKVPIQNRYKNPQQVGQDRLVCAYAASVIYGAPSIVVDLGTAITLDAVSARQEYLGGIIVPGIRITAETLFERTALLPLVDIKRPKDLIGRDTQGSILSGIFYGYGEMIKGLVGLLQKKLKGSRSARVILTGGHAQLMAGYIREKRHVVDGDLVMKGLARLAIKRFGVKAS